MLITAKNLLPNLIKEKHGTVYSFLSKSDFTKDQLNLTHIQTKKVTDHLASIYHNHDLNRLISAYFKIG